MKFNAWMYINYVLIHVSFVLDESILSQAPHSTDVFNLLKVKAYDWDNIGRGFEVPYGYREGLKRKGVTSTDEGKLEDVIMKWMESECSDVTWNKVIEVLKKLQYNDLIQPAKEIFKRLSGNHKSITYSSIVVLLIHNVKCRAKPFASKKDWCNLPQEIAYRRHDR